jgi:hypothetical protein
MKTQDNSKESQPITATKLAYERDKKREKVKGIFRFYEIPGGEITFYFREFKGDPIQKYTLHDGEICTLPLGVAKHLNSNCWYPIHSHRLDENGNASTYVGTKVRRCGFQSLEFTDAEEKD